MSSSSSVSSTDTSIVSSAGTSTSSGSAHNPSSSTHVSKTHSIFIWTVLAVTGVLLVFELALLAGPWVKLRAPCFNSFNSCETFSSYTLSDLEEFVPGSPAVTLAFVSLAFILGLGLIAFSLVLLYAPKVARVIGPFSAIMYDILFAARILLYLIANSVFAAVPRRFYDHVYPRDNCLREVCYAPDYGWVMGWIVFLILCLVGAPLAFFAKKKRLHLFGKVSNLAKEKVKTTGLKKGIQKQAVSETSSTSSSEIYSSV